MAHKIRGTALAQRQYEDDGGEISYTFDQLVTDPIGDPFHETPAVLVLTDERVFTESEVRAIVQELEEFGGFTSIQRHTLRNAGLLDPA